MFVLSLNYNVSFFLCDMANIIAAPFVDVGDQRISKLTQTVEHTGAHKRRAEQSQSCVIEYPGWLGIDDLAVIKTALPTLAVCHI